MAVSKVVKTLKTGLCFSCDGVPEKKHGGKITFQHVSFEPGFESS
jgi:hypothetical protein